MKRFITLLTLILSLTTAVFAQQAELDNIIASIRLGNAEQLSQYFDNSVELTLPDKSNSYSKGQATLVLKDFFAANPVKRFEIIHKGINTGAQYCIGTLITKSGEFRATIFLKQKGDIQVLQELRLEAR